jgi:protein-L-isoaspartate(D-aspartate) O-methyltransferase
MRLRFFADRRADEPPPATPNAAEFVERRQEMVARQLQRRGVNASRVLTVMASVPREEFVSREFRHQAYDDAPLPIGAGQTISQPYIVAAMTAALELTGNERVLDVGTGCGYQAALLSQLAQEVFTIERNPELATSAAKRLAQLGYANVQVHCRDGTLGLPQFAPFDAILVAAAAPEIPDPLRAQLADAGRLILPVGNADDQELHLVRRQGEFFCTSILDACRFVPLVGYHGWKESPPR